MKRKSLCLHCEHLLAEPPYKTLHCTLGRHVLTINDPPLCRRYEPVQEPKSEPVSNAQLSLLPT